MHLLDRIQSLQYVYSNAIYGEKNIYCSHIEKASTESLFLCSEMCTHKGTEIIMYNHIQAHIVPQCTFQMCYASIHVRIS